METMSQNKKCVNLNEINIKFTQEILISILSKAYNGKQVQLVDWNFYEGSTKGDNYLSNIYKGKVNGIINGDPKQYVQINIVVKSMPKNPGTRKSLRCTDFFCNEINFYTKIASKFENFLASKRQSDLLCIPRYLASYIDGENDFIVLEDVSHLGFHNLMRQNCLDWIEFTTVIKTLAAFHAISFAYKEQKKEEFTKIASSLKETMFDKEYWNWYKGYHKKIQDLVKHALATEYPNSEAEQQYNSYESYAFFDKCIELCTNRVGPTSVITEGDCWIPNFLIRDIGQDKKEALMLDFQISRYASPVLDLSFLIYSCTLKPFRDQYFDDILKIYHSELSNAIKLLGSDPEKVYPWNLFIKEIQEQSVFGVLASLNCIPIILEKVPESFSIDTAFISNEAVDIGEMVSFSNFQISGRLRLADVVVHAFEKGFI